MRIGLFLRNLDEEYQLKIYRGIRDRSHALGHELICVQGETIGESGSGLYPFVLAHQISFQGILVLAPVIFDQGMEQRIDTIPDLLPRVPVVSMGMRILGTTSVIFESVESMTRIMEHLVMEHGCRRFLFVGGHHHHADTRTRESIFTGTLRRYSLLWPEISWTIDYGAYHVASGVEIMRAHLSDLPYDAVVAANDNMALGIQRVLSIQENEAWRRCAVTGFDDIAKARLAVRPLTTVHTALETMGSLALDTLVDLVQGKKVKRTISISTRAVFRGSCGCEPKPQDDWVNRDAESSMNLRQFMESDQWLQECNYFGRDLSGIFDMKTLLDRLNDFLQVLRVRDFLLLVDGVLLYDRSNNQGISLLYEGISMDLPTLLELKSKGSSVAREYCIYHLRYESEPLGVVVYAGEDNSLVHLTSSMPHVDSAIHRIRNRAAQEGRNHQLEALVQHRTRELMLANETLEEEVRLRRIAEAEVLQISEFERQRFGFDLHDDICQRLAGLTMYVRAMSMNTPGNVQEVWSELGSMIDETLYLTRQYAHASFPFDMKTRGLDAVLRNLCETLSRQKLLCCDYTSSLPDLLGTIEELSSLHLFRFVQEALHNAVKHSGAKRIIVSVEEQDLNLVFQVQDNGRGIPPEQTGLEGLGFRSMAYRARQLGSELELESEEGLGTTLRISVPKARILGNPV